MQQTSQKQRITYIFWTNIKFLKKQKVGTILLCDIIDHMIYIYNIYIIYIYIYIFIIYIHIYIQIFQYANIKIYSCFQEKEPTKPIFFTNKSSSSLSNTAAKTSAVL